MEKLRRIQEILEVLKDDQRYLDQTVLEIKERATGSLNWNGVTFKESP
jgi:hypothetical protein